MSGSTECVADIHDNRTGGSGDRVALIPKKRKKEPESPNLVSKVAKTTQVSEKMQRNHGNGMASSHDAVFSIDKILSPSFRDAVLSSSKLARGAEITKNSGGLPSSPSDENKMKDASEGKETAEVERGGIDNMPADKWYNTLLWQQHQQQYQQQLAASAFYHMQHLQHHLPNGAAPPPQHQPYFGPGSLLVPPSGIPPALCPTMPGKVHPFNCQCAELMNEQPYFLLTPAGYSIPSPFQTDHHYSSLRYCRRRKARTVFTEYQIQGLEARFVHQQYLSTHERVELANVLFLTEGQVKTWFQNRRMKQKKLARDSEHPGDDDDDNDELDFDEEAEGEDGADDDVCTETPQTNDAAKK